MKTILIATHNQFGYQINAYYYSKYLNEKFNVEYVCFDSNKPKIILEGVKVHYVKRREKLSILNYFVLSFSIIKILKRIKPENVIVKYYPTVSVIAFKFEKAFLDIRTASVSNNRTINLMLDLLLKFETFFFKNILILSESLKQKLKIKKAHVVPLGAEKSQLAEKRFEELNLVYVGTLNNRNIEQSILGFHSFLSENRSTTARYHIIGDGKEKYKQKVIRIIRELELDKFVILHGYIPNNKLNHILNDCNIGISYVPINEYFQYQPPTKTYEYLMAGMPVLATRTYENELIVNQSNGVLIYDTPESFNEGLKTLWSNKKHFNSTDIVHSIERFSWENIVCKNLIERLNK